MSSSEFVQASTASLGEALASINPRLSIAAIALFVGYNAGPLVAAAEDLRWQATVALGQELKTLLKAAGETPLVPPPAAPAALVAANTLPAPIPPTPAPVLQAPVQPVVAPLPVTAYGPVKLHRTWHGDHGGSRSTPTYREYSHDLPKYSAAPMASACGPTPN